MSKIDTSAEAIQEVRADLLTCAEIRRSDPVVAGAVRRAEAFIVALAIERDKLRAEVEAREQAAAMAMRAAAIEEVTAEALECAQRGDRSGATAATNAANDIHALPLPTDAIAAMLAQARREGMEEAAAYLDDRAKWLRLRDAEDRGLPDSMGHSFEANAAEAWAAAIRAAAKKLKT